MNIEEYVPRRSERGSALIEGILIALLLAGIGVTGWIAIQNRQEKEHTQSVQLTLYRAAVAAEEFAAAMEGDYEALADEGAEGLYRHDFDPPSGIEVSVLKADSDSYCLQAIHDALEGDNWGTATFASYREGPSSADQC